MRTPHTSGMTFSADDAPPPSGAADDAEAIVGAGLEATERLLLETQRQAAEMALTLTQEMMEFAVRRVRAQVVLFETLSRCTDFPSILAAQLDFLGAAGADCADELGQLAKAAEARLGAKAAA